MSTINGLNFATAKRAVEYAFTDDEILVIKNKEINGYFAVYVDKKVEKKEIKKLKAKYNCFRVFLVTVEESE